jgi:DNA-binding MarR family transcriptional regulator
MPTVVPKQLKQSRSEARLGAFRLDNHVFYLFGQIFGHRNIALNRELRRFNLDYSRWRVLAALNEHPDCSMNDLANTTAVDRTTLAYTIRNMVEEKLVRRQARSSDRRSVELTLTQRGHALLQQILPTVMHLNDRCLAGFTQREFTVFLGQLRRIIDNIKD